MFIDLSPDSLVEFRWVLWAILWMATGCLPSDCPNSEHPKTACRLAARHSSAWRVCWGCTNPAKVRLEKVLGISGDFVGGAGMECSMEHFVHMQSHASICPVDGWDGLQSTPACCGGRACRRPRTSTPRAAGSNVNEKVKLKHA